MNDTVDTISNVVPSATPTEDELAAWQALPRDEQLKRLRAQLNDPDCSTVGTASMTEILGRAQATARGDRG